MATKDISDVQVLQAYLESRWLRSRGSEVWPYELLQRWTGECQKVCWRAMERACDRGLIEFGVSLRTGWVTAEGHAELAKFRKLSARHSSQLVN